MSIMRSNIARQLYNTGGIANLINTYQNNPTLQSQMTQQEYLDLFSARPTSTTEQIIQSSVAPTIQPIVKKPILPIIPESSGDDDDGGRTKSGIMSGVNFDYGYTGPSGEFNLDDIREGTVADEDYTLGMRLSDLGSGIMQVGKDIYDAVSPIQIAKRTKDAIDDMRAKRAAEIIEQIRLEEERRLKAQLRQPGDAISQGRSMQQSYEDHFSNMGYSSPTERAADTPTGTLGRI